MSKHETNNKMRKFMNKWDGELSDDDQREMWNMLNDIVDRAKLDIVEDAEKAISKLRVFSL